jgi:alkylation response protein AidB-like acyl-CoA dehydrogenase
MFIVPMDAAGITVRPIKQMNGKSNFNEVWFDGVVVGAEQVVGGINAGWQAAGRVLQIERAINRMYRSSMFENELRHLAKACTSDARLKHLVAQPAWQQRFGRCLAEIGILRRLVWRAISDLSATGSLNHSGSAIKLHWSETHQLIAALGLELLGHAAAPFTPATRRAIERFNELYLRTRGETIQGGTTAVQLGIIAKHLLRLPSK